MKQKRRVLPESVLVKEYDIYIPLNYNDGTPIDARKFQELQRHLLGYFGGVTYFRNPTRVSGSWRTLLIAMKSSFIG